MENFTKPIVVIDDNGIILFINKTFTKQVGFTHDECIGANARSLNAGTHTDDFYFKLKRALRKNSSWDGEMWIKTKGGELLLYNVDIYPSDFEYESGLYVCMLNEISDMEEIRKDLALAHKIQQDVLPEDINNDYLNMHTIYKPSNFVSGDLYDFRWEEEKKVLSGHIIDVMGHGVATALQTSALRILFMQAYDKNRSHLERVKWVNQKACAYFTDSTFAAAISFRVDFRKMQLEVISAGINYFLKSNQTDHTVKIAGSFIGLQETTKYHKSIIDINAGECIYFMSDGLLDVLSSEFKSNVGSFSNDVKTLNQICQQDLHDDVSAICIEVKKQID